MFFFQLTGHIRRIHEKAKELHYCDKCPYHTYTNKALQIHIALEHDNVKNYLCDKCDYAFDCKSRLMRHYVHIHEKRRLYVCPDCPFQSDYKRDLVAHGQGEHGKDFGFITPDLGDIRLPKPKKVEVKDDEEGQGSQDNEEEDLEENVEFLDDFEVEMKSEDEEDQAVLIHEKDFKSKKMKSKVKQTLELKFDVIISDSQTVDNNNPTDLKVMQQGETVIAIEVWNELKRILKSISEDCYAKGQVCYKFLEDNFTFEDLVNSMGFGWIRCQDDHCQNWWKCQMERVRIDGKAFQVDLQIKKENV